MTTIGTQSYPTLSTDRLVLRQLTDEDAGVVFALRSNAEVCKYIARPLQTHIDEAKAFIEKIKKEISEDKCRQWLLTLSDSQAIIGSVCLWNFSDDKTTAELGYDMLPEYHGKGYMNEAVQTVLDYGFNTRNFQAIEAFTHRDNLKSRQLLERNGFIFCEGRVDEDVPTNVVYSKERFAN